MAMIEQEFEINSILVNKKFIEELFKIIDVINPKDIGIKTEITVYSEQGKTTFEDLKDFTESRMLLKEIEKISIKKTSHNKREREKVIRLFLNIDEYNPYYQLIGYDNGKLSTCQKQLDNLFDKYKIWYHFLFKLPGSGVIPFFVSISFAILIWNLLPLLQNSIINEYRGLISVVSFFAFIHYFNKAYSFMFPFFDFQINKPKRNDVWRGVIGAISLGLIVNLIWEVIKWIFHYK